MREIKFRAWDGKKMYNHGILKFNGLIIKQYVEYNQYCCEEQIKEKSAQHDIMQFTGLKDLDEIEIYEGDIIHWVVIGDIEGNPEDIGRERDMGNHEVIFKNGKFSIPKPEIPIGHINTSVKIIGNIYKNPELIDVDYTTDETEVKN